MKRFNSFFKNICLVLLLGIACLAQAQEQTQTAPANMDSVKISLLTCSPGTEVWSLYGHTAIRVVDPQNGQDIAINYGMFNFHQPNFILRFVFGLTDYEMGIVPFSMFMMEYAQSGRGVIEQQLDLSNEDKAAILSALSTNYLPQNRVYRYNYFTDNCTTRARNIITNHIYGHVIYANNAPLSTSYRRMIHQWNEEHQWARFGNDLLLGVKADALIDPQQQQFLPATLEGDFAHATIVAPNGSKRPLVSATTVLLKPNPANQPDTHDIWNIFSPRLTFTLLLLLVAIVTAIEWKRGKTFWLLDTILLTVDGVAGLILFAMLFSQHPTVNRNMQILLLNPLSILFAYNVIAFEIKRRFHWYWRVLAVCIIIFFVGNFFQDYAAGTNLLALTLLLRVASNYFIHFKSKT